MIRLAIIENINRSLVHLSTYSPAQITRRRYSQADGTLTTHSAIGHPLRLSETSTSTSDPTPATRSFHHVRECDLIVVHGHLRIITAGFN
jgi:hypothetical protein